MLDCTAPMTPLVLFAAALVARAAVAALYGEPAYPDSFYYVNLARELASGNGFQLDYIWNFVDVGGRLPAEPVLPIPSNGHWMPLAAIVQVPFIWLMGPTWLASALPFWLAGALAAPLAWRIARDARAERTVAITAGVLVALPGAVLPFMAQPDNFGLFMLLGALALWLAGRAWQGDGAALIAGGVVVGLATLARNDGVLLGIPFALIALRETWRARPAGWPAMARAAALGAGCLIAFGLLVGPWLLRQLEVFGTIAPSAASGRILWISEYRQLWSISDSPSLQSLLAQGLPELLGSRLTGLVAAVAIFVLWPLATVMAPFVVIGAWQRRRDRLFRPTFIYAAVLFAASGLLFAVHVPYGTFIHSAVALVPHALVLGAIGVAAVVGWIAERRAGWQPERARRMFSAGAVAVTALVAAVQTSTATVAWQRDRDQRLAVTAPLAAVAAGERLMSADPGAYRYLVGRGGVVTPDDPLAVIEQTARAYGIRWLALERNHIVPALAPVLTGDLRPAWLSEAVEVYRAAPATDGIPQAALYAVCLAPADVRCAP